MRIGLLLGTFDPPHIGHLYLATQALNEDIVDRVWVVPAWNSPWKPEATPYDLRLRMCEKLTKDCPKISTSFFDKVAKSNYSHEFLKKLSESIPSHEYTIISGSDIDFSKWKEGEWVESNFKQFVVPRASLECSSTYVRELIKNGKNPIPFTPPNVYQIIKDRKLYDS